ncbi:MAG: FecR family protein [Patescibacteria group bacterium]
MYQTYQRRPRRLGSFFFPFLSLIILGLIVVLVFQIVDYFQEKRVQSLENKAAVTVAAGRAEMKIWGVDQWTNVIDGSILNEGDKIRTLPGSRAVLTLLNKSTIRLDSETEVEIAGLKSRDSQDDVTLNVIAGQVWIMRSDQPTVRSAHKVMTQHLEVTSLGTIFNVSQGSRESVQVLEGKVSVAVKIEDPENAGRLRTAETLDVALGQEVSLRASDLADLRASKVISPLVLLSDEFRTSEWYIWNRQEDRVGTAAVSVADAVAQQQESNVSPLSMGLGSTTTPVSEITAVLSAPVILTPVLAERTTKAGSVTITGTVSSATEKLEVATYVTGRAEPYLLQKYKAGSEKWSYVAASQYGNFLGGTNRFIITAIGKNGERSDPAEIEIFYDKPKEPADLSAPKVVSFNGTDKSETMEDSVKIDGTIGKGIEKVFVNDFALSKYIPDSKTWAYYAKTSYGNLKDGENEFSVYGVDVDGNKTPVTKFTITKKPKPAPTAPTPAPTPTPSLDPAPAPVPVPPPAPVGAPVL